MRELEELLEEAGHAGFRDARGPMGFTQRQAGGKFTAPEAAEFIEKLQTELYGDGPPPGSWPSSAATPPEAEARPETAAAEGKPAAKKSNAALAEISSEDLAAELQARGWIVAAP